MRTFQCVVCKMKVETTPEQYGAKAAIKREGSNLQKMRETNDGSNGMKIGGDQLWRKT